MNTPVLADLRRTGDLSAPAQLHHGLGGDLQQLPRLFGRENVPGKDHASLRQKRGTRTERVWTLQKSSVEVN